MINHTPNKEYDLKLKEFAITLQFLSPRAYEFIRTSFDKALPSISTIRRWYKSVDCRPGYIVQSFNFLKKMSELHATLPDGTELTATKRISAFLIFGNIFVTF